MSKSLSLDQASHNYYVSVVNGKLTEEELPAQIID